MVGEEAFWVSADQQHHSDPRKNNKSHNSHRSVDLSSSAKSTYCYKQLERMTDYVRKCLRQETENLVQGIQPSAVQKLICDRWFVNVSDSEPCSVPSSNTHRAPLISPFLISFSKYIGENPRLLSSDLLFHCVFRGRWEHAENKKNWEKATEEAPGDRDSPASGNTSSLLYSRSGFITQGLGGLAWS